jgi:hypothetical protein
MRIIHNIQ